MNKQIEEMAIKELADGLDITMCGAEEILTYLMKQGYQKVGKDSVVLTKEEYDNLKIEIQKAHNKGVRAGFDLTKYKENSIAQARKETVREILQQLNGHGTTYVKKWIKEQYGVDLGE